MGAAQVRILELPGGPKGIERIEYEFRNGQYTVRFSAGFSDVRNFWSLHLTTRLSVTPVVFIGSCTGFDGLRDNSTLKYTLMNIE